MYTLIFNPLASVLADSYHILKEFYDDAVFYVNLFGNFDLQLWTFFVQRIF